MSPAPGVAPSRATASGTVRKYLEVARVALANRLAYLGDALSRPVFLAVLLVVFVQLWKKVFTPDRPVVAGFGVVETLWYFVMTETITLSAPRLEGRVDEEVKTGSLAYLLCRPCDYVLYHLSYSLGETLPLFVLNAAAGALLVGAFIGPLPLAWSGLPLVAGCVVLAFVLHFYVSMGIALLAFWVEDATPFFWIYNKMLFILGGLMIPLDLYPAWLRSFTELLPFRHILFGPARLLVRFSTADGLALVAWQVAWIAVFGLVAHSVFAAGVRRLHIQGG